MGSLAPLSLEDSRQVSQRSLTGDLVVQSMLPVLPEYGPTSCCCWWWFLFLFFQVQPSIKKKMLSKRSQEERKFCVL